MRIDGHDQAAILRALDEAKASDRPSLIACKTTIGFGAPTKAGTSKAHGEALGAEEIAGARKNLHWPYEPFVIPDEILQRLARGGLRGAAGARSLEAPHTPRWTLPKRAEFERRIAGDLPAGLERGRCRRTSASSPPTRPRSRPGRRARPR